MDSLQREGRPTDQERTPPCWATCGNCAWIRDLSDYVSMDDSAFGVCVEEEPYARVARDFRRHRMPCGGEQWVMR